MEEEEGRRGVLERKLGKGGEKEQILKCPRCNSNNTKFCYYNNYSLSQPRYFCKSCRRYWTAGGSLRNIPVGGASRKNKPRPNSSSSSSSSSSNSNSNNMINGTSCCLLSDEMDGNHGMVMMSPREQELIPFMPIPPSAPDYNSPSRNLCTATVFQPEAGDQSRSFFTTSLQEEDFKQNNNGPKLGDVAGFWNGIFGAGSW